MSRTKKIFFVVSVLFSAEFLCQPFLTDGRFSRIIRHIPAQIEAASRSNSSTVKSDSPAKTAGRLVLELPDEPNPRPAGFLTANAKADFPFRCSLAALHRFRTILAPKVSRYIAKSVLNI
jgi:hypothetical protein